MRRANTILTIGELNRYLIETHMKHLERIFGLPIILT